MIPMLLGRNLLAWSMQVTILIGVGLTLLAKCPGGLCHDLLVDLDRLD